MNKLIPCTEEDMEGLVAVAGSFTPQVRRIYGNNDGDFSVRYDAGLSGYVVVIEERGKYGRFAYTTQALELRSPADCLVWAKVLKQDGSEFLFTLRTFDGEKTGRIPKGSRLHFMIIYTIE